MDGQLIYSVPTGDPRWRVYLHALVDMPGVVLPNTYLSAFNPVGSGVLFVALALNVSTYAIANTQAPNSLRVDRISASSGGTLITASAVNRFLTAHPDPKTQVRVGNPTLTTTGEPLFGVPPIVSSGAGQSSASAAPPPGASFFCFPGEGVAFRTLAGSVNQLWNIQLTWAEVGIDSVRS